MIWRGIERLKCITFELKRNEKTYLESMLPGIFIIRQCIVLFKSSHIVNTSYLRYYQPQERL